MAKDVAQRDLDMAGFHLFNVGPPQNAGDPTQVDQQSVPLPASGAGTPGQSLLAAAVDHVHPGQRAPVILQLEGDVGGAQSGPNEIVVFHRFVDFTEMDADTFNAVVTGFVSVDAGDTGTFNVRLGGSFLQADGDVIATITTQSAATEPGFNAGPPVPRPSGPTVVKVTAAAVAPTATARIDNIRITLAG